MRIMLLIVTACLTIAATCSFPMPSRTVKAAEGIGSVIEIVIEDSAYHVRSGFLKVGEVATIRLRNADSITHGFNWALVETKDVRIDTDGVETDTIGFRGLHLSPGQDVRIRFTPVREGKVTFTCDLHPDMKGEVFMLRVSPA